MNYSLFDFFRMIGSLAFFLFGMKMMSDSLQKVAGDKMRGILESMTSNRFKGVLTGVLITAIIQSSSATTVMVVSFVNAGLLTLVQSIGVIMGANIGTTVTAWLISILGFKVDMSVFALPLIGFSLPLLFSKSLKKKSWGELIVGFSIIFIGLQFLNDSMPDINSNPSILSFFANYSGHGYWSILFFLLVGTIITLVIQSSSAAMALTLVMCYNGWIQFDMAVAMVLGQNIGTTVTANIAALVANSTAKQAAMAHLLFNLIGVVLVMVFFYPFEHFVAWIMSSLNMNLPYMVNGQTLQETNEAMPVALSIYHTVFNVLNTTLLIWFVPALAKLVQRIVKTKEDEDEFKLKFINSGIVSLNEASTLQAKKEIEIFIQRTQKMYDMTKSLYHETKPAKIEKYIEKIRKYENIADTIDIEIANFLTKITTADLSKVSSDNINLMLRLDSRIESVNDSCSVMAELIYTKISKKMEFTSDMEEKIEQLFGMIDEFLLTFTTSIQKKNAFIDVAEFRIKRDAIESFNEKLNIQNLKDIKKGVYKYKIGIVYTDLFTEMGVMADHIYHGLKYMADIKM